MSNVVNFPKKRSDFKEKIIKLETYIKANLIVLAQKKKELEELKIRVEKLQKKGKLRVVSDETSKGPEN